MPNIGVASERNGSCQRILVKMLLVVSKTRICIVFSMCTKFETEMFGFMSGDNDEADVRTFEQIVLTCRCLPCLGFLLGRGD